MEHAGVEPHLRYYPTRKDWTENEKDLFEFLGKVLSERG